ncbi:MAG: hypothetical protein KatS3mg008_0156 [Acidimicrobiales bacterium]|nr:MAG: hypothetical protein KatS3mg008_0156 [Acidimicrobiales bacterium]
MLGARVLLRQEASTLLFTALLVLHIIVSILLIFLVLLHSGRGGGLSDMFGGGLGATALGSTVVERNLDRITVVVALIFGFTTVLVALLIDA